jgi:hypothetical protein
MDKALKVNYSQYQARRARQEISKLLRDVKIHEHVHISPSVVPVRKYIHSVHNVTNIRFKIHFNIILLSASSSFK